MTEVWKPVLGIEQAYEVSSQGRVRRIIAFRSDGKPRRLVNGGIKKLYVNHDGYYTCSLHYGRAFGPQLVHRLMLSAFHRAPLPHEVARHLNGNRLDNRIENLAWGTVLENTQDRERHGTQRREERHHSSRLTREQVLEIRSITLSTRVRPSVVRVLAEKYGVSESLISRLREKNTAKRLWCNVIPESWKNG